MKSSLDPEYHTARLLLLVDSVTAVAGLLDGLTKLAKLDFLVRYPSMLRRLLDEDDATFAGSPDARLVPVDAPVESRMMRYKYGPWDDSYYVLIGAMISRGLVEETDGRGKIALRPTPLGRQVAADLREHEDWRDLADRCALVARRFDVAGSVLKARIYNELPDVVDRPQRSEI